MPRISSNFLAQTYKERYSLDVFVETGLFRGESVEDAVEMGFKEIYSCDLNPDYIVAAQDKWPWGQFFIGESQECLKKICELNDKPTLFWLDAHLPLYHDMDEPSKESRCPLYEELDVIRLFKCNVHRDVIMCDDTNVIMMNNPNSYTERDVAVDQLIHFIDYQKLINMFNDTHQVKEYPKTGHGIVVFEPKDG